MSIRKPSPAPQTPRQDRESHMHAVMIHARETRGTGIGAAKDRCEKERNTGPQRDPRERDMTCWVPCPGFEVCESASRCLPCPDCLNVACGITACGNRYAILTERCALHRTPKRGCSPHLHAAHRAACLTAQLCGRSLRLRTAHWAVRFTAQQVGREEALPWPMATKAW